jgi:sodium transport system permease protein
MMRVLKGEGFGLEQVVVPLVVCVLLTVAGVVFVARRLCSAAVR